MGSGNTRSVAGLVDPDVDLHVPEQRRELGEHPVAVLGSIAAVEAVQVEGLVGVKASSVGQQHLRKHAAMVVVISSFPSSVVTQQS